MRCYCTCNLRAAARRPELLERHLQAAIAPELGLDPLLLDASSPHWHAVLAARLDAARLPRAVHLPFFDLQPGSADSRIRQASRNRLRQAMGIARIYNPDHLIGHAAFNPFLYARSFPDWATRAAETWAEALADWPDHPPLFLENTHESDPTRLRDTIEALRRRLPAQADRIAGCLDIGHWHSFAEGRLRQNLDHWLDTLAPCLGHLHLHDNDGSFDQHLGPGQGDIPFDRLFEELDNRNLQPTATFEPHTDLAYGQCLTFVSEHPALTW